MARALIRHGRCLRNKSPRDVQKISNKSETTSFSKLFCFYSPTKRTMYRGIVIVQGLSIM